ncbi:MAG: BACON domain-containing carbohydrate-binding protein [Vicinamibacterales bacterium]
MSVTEGALDCTVTLSSPGSTFPAGGATGSLTVSTAATCAWTAVSSASWLTISAGTTGTGNGIVAFAIGPNADPSTRGGTIAVNDKSASVSQEGDLAYCSFTVAPLSFTPCISQSPDMTATVSTQAGCQWTAGPTASWVNLTGGQSGIGSGLVSFRVEDNFGDRRYSKVEVRGPTGIPVQSVDVAQAGCTYEVSPASMLLSAAGGPGLFQVVTQTIPSQCSTGTPAKCQWTAVSNAPWITVTTPMPQVGDSAVNFVLAPNNTGTLRTSTIVVGNQVVSISQGG